MTDRAALGVALPLALMFAAAELPGQVRQLDPSGTLDANPMIGGDGSNAPTPAGDRRINSQLYVNGQVTGLAGFRGNVGYRASDQLGINVPSADFSDFRRRSINAGEAEAYGGYVTRPYYSRGTTVVGSAGILSGQAAPGTNVPISQVPSAYAGISRQLYIDAMKNYYQSSAPLAFDILVPPPQPMMMRQVPGYGVSVPNAAVTAAQLEAPSAEAPGLLAIPSGQARRDLAMQLFLDRRRDEMVRQGGRESPAPEAGALDPIQPLHRPLERAGAAQAPANQDVFLDMLLRMRGAGGDANSAAPAPAVPAATDPNASARPAIVVRTLAGQARDAFNLSVSKAEKAIKDGRFYEAADLFEAASEVRAESPLPVVGMGLSLLAAGEPLSAAHKIRQAMRIFPPVMEARFDLKAMIGADTAAAVIGQVDSAAAQSTPQSAALLNFLAAFVHRNSGDVAKAKDHAARIAPALAGNTEEDKVLTGYADFILKGKPAATTRPATTRPR
jgi:hypothetical protein